MITVIGDIHGIPEITEMYNLLRGLGSTGIYCVGDLFDRGANALSVWHVIQSPDVKCVLGNHEKKMLDFLTGKRDNLPQHYYYALDNLRQGGVTKSGLVGYLQSLPLRIRLSVEDREVVIVHAGVDPQNPFSESLSWNVYGNGGLGVIKSVWWEDYKLDNPVVIYGHLSQDAPNQHLARIMRNSLGWEYSVGLDTCACTGGPLTAYCVETGATIAYQTGINHFENVKAEIKYLGKEHMDNLRQQLFMEW